MKTTVTHTLHDAIEVSYQDQTLFKYVYESKNPTRESPRPYFHPLKTLSGNNISLFRPYDHLWHIGLTMCIANLSGENFWGGPTYVRDKGYVQLANNGRIQHSAWQEITCEDEKVHCHEQLKWITQAGETWFDETRAFTVSEINPETGYWALDFSFRLVNVTQRTLSFGSPTTEGRPEAGYGSLFWRGPRSFLNGRIMGADGLEGPGAMGKRSPWLAFSGKHDENQAQSTIMFIDHPENPRYPNKWFVRNDPYACISCAFMFDEYYDLKPDEELALHYQVVIANGEWSRAQLEEYAAHHQSAK